MKTHFDNLGLRHNNPLNIRYTSRNRWQGLDPAMPAVRGFCRFVSRDYGLRAALILICRYMRRYDLRTPRAVIARWAPPSENDVARYVANVCLWCRWTPHTVLSTEGSDVARLVAAMARQETGMRLTVEEVQRVREHFGV